MTVKEVTRQYRLEQWREIIQDRIKSGLKVDEYCRQNNISRHVKSCVIDDNFGIKIDALDCDDRILARFKPDELLDNRLELLNESEELKPGKWNYETKVHLWNFNLHYFEYFISLAAKYNITQNEKYFDKMLYLYNDWKKACFYKQSGDAWYPYTISLRLRNSLIAADI